TLIHVTDGGLTIEERPSAALEFQRRQIDISDCRNVADVQERVATQVRSLRGGTAVVVRLTLTGGSALNWQLRRDADLLQAVAEEAAEAAGSVWIDRLRVETQAPEAGGTSDTAEQEIAGLITEAAQAPGLPAEAAEILSEVLADLPPEIRDAWGADETATARSV